MKVQMKNRISIVVVTFSKHKEFMRVCQYHTSFSNTLCSSQERKASHGHGISALEIWKRPKMPRSCTAACSYVRLQLLPEMNRCVLIVKNNSEDLHLRLTIYIKLHTMHIIRVFIQLLLQEKRTIIRKDQTALPMHWSRNFLNTKLHQLSLFLQTRVTDFIYWSHEGQKARNHANGRLRKSWMFYCTVVSIFLAIDWSCLYRA